MFEGVGSPQQTPRTTGGCVNSSSHQRKENDISISHLSSDIKTMDNPSQDGEKEPQIRIPAMIHTDPYSATRIASSQSMRHMENQQQDLTSQSYVCKKESHAHDPVSNLQAPPRVQVRSNSAFPEAVEIHTKMNTHSARVQFDRSRRVISQPALLTAPSDMPLSHAPHSIAKDAWNSAQRSSEDSTSEGSCERVPTVQSVPRMETEVVGNRSQAYLSTGPWMDDGVNEGLQHIGKYNGLWFVAIAILVGIFLCLFMYAFHILK